MTKSRASLLGIILATSLLAGCGDDEEKPKATCTTAPQSGCEAGFVCEEVSGGTPACFKPLTLEGRVFDALDTSAIEGARVVARDANDVAVSGIASTDAMGVYRLTVPAPRAADGTVIDTDYTLRADALGYLTFPKAPRVALPIDLSDAAGDPPLLKSAATDIGLLPLEDSTGLGAISGTVTTEVPAGTLVVAGESTATADTNGAYVVFNVPAGDVEARAYLSGVNFDPVMATVSAGATTENVNFSAVGPATVTVSGNVQIVNAPGGSETSVILVVEATFDETLARGESPPGLRVSPVSGAWSIANVPNGSYAVLAAFENDGLVRDPDTSIGGTLIQRITVPDQLTAEGFKVTAALAVISPGADEIEIVSGTPTFTWEDDSSEDAYDVEVFDALGNLVWSTNGNFDPGGNDPASVVYGGPALTSGMYYQFRATSLAGGVPISRTEDLKGVFIAE